ncbi:hypothetical protein B0H15DRAFT_807264 [Mycena belliarum]|uniref:Protein kinase domain-containing protein n=1 Tax=Mycena belliarum TaxID=1033014 RepID=A0AAD6XL29_9AGAR|nr:hypothetical protein B0H15DRAFT_807264 [Mycena belliae]
MRREPPRAIQDSQKLLWGKYEKPRKSDYPYPPAALAHDLDILLPQHPALSVAINRATANLRAEWDKQFGDAASARHGLRETATREASRIILHSFAIRAFRAIELAAAHTAAVAQVLWSPTTVAPLATSFEIDHTLSLDGDHILGMDDELHIALPHAAAELSTRGISGRVVEVEADAPTDQPTWWIIANKGAFYSGAYGVDWVVFAGLTAYCVGYRTGSHMLWSSPIYNRRDPGDEVIPSSALSKVFGDAPLSTNPQTGLPLLFLAIVLKGMMGKGLLWLEQMFPRLFGLTFDTPSGEPRLDGAFARYGRDATRVSDKSGASSDSGVHGDKASRGGNAPIIRPPGPATTIVAGRHRFIGDWLGELRHPAGYSVQIEEPLSQGSSATVYAGKLLQHGAEVAPIAIKTSDAIDTLLAEFARFRDLQDIMGASIPRCYGVCVASGTAFLVTKRVACAARPAPARDLSTAERGAVYAVLRKMHEGGWAHNDVVDRGNKALHNLLWDDRGRPVVIDLVTVASHVCGGRCTELDDLGVVLGLSPYEIGIWARG